MLPFGRQVNLLQKGEHIVVFSDLFASREFYKKLITSRIVKLCQDKYTI